MINLEKRYKSKFVLRNVNVEFKRGQKYGLIGKNAAGKTTLFKILSKLNKPSSGHYENTFKCIEYIDDKYTMIGENIFEFLSFYRTTDKNFEYQNVINRLDAIGIDLKDKIVDLSKGQKAIVRLITAQESSSDLILVDELLDGLDLIRRKQVINSINTDVNYTRTYIIVDHNLDDLINITKDLLYIKNKKIYTVKNVNEKIREHEKFSIWFKKDVDLEES
jgi:ABC-2 type transport system ATP-binding protein